MQNNVAVQGTVQAAQGFGLSEWRLDYRAGTDASGSSGWTTLLTASNEVTDGTLLPAWNVSALAAGPYVLRLRATDASGFISSTTHVVVEVDHDETPPEAPGVLGISGSVLAGVVKTGNKLELVGQAAPETFVARGVLIDTSTGTELLDVSTSITIHRNGSIRGTLPLPNLTGVATVSLQLTVQDAVGNVSPPKTSNALVVDTAAPSVTVNFPFASATLPLAQVVVTGQAADAGAAGVDRVEFSTDNSTWYVATGTTGWSHAWTPSANGNYTLYLRAVDRLGNVGTTQLNVTVSNLYPSAYITAPAQGALINEGALVDVVGTATDSSNFDFYVLQVAPGVSPVSGYTNITGVTNTPVVDGLLGVWNTTGLGTGPHTLRLFVFDTTTNFVRFDKIVQLQARVNLDGIPDAVLNEDTSIQDFVHLPDYASALNDDPADLSYTITNITNASAGVSIDANKNIDIAPAANWHGVATVTVTASNGTLSNSDTFTVTVLSVNDLPTQPQVAISPADPATTDPLLCTVLVPSFDADGDTVTYHYDWFESTNGLNYTLIASASTTALSNTLASSLTVNGRYYRCRVTPHDGIAPGPSAVSTVIVRLASSISAAVTPASITLGQGLTISGAITGTLGQGTVVGLTSTAPSGVVDPNFPEAAVAASTSYTRTFYPDEASEGRAPWAITASWPGDASYRGAASAAQSFTVAKAQPSLGIRLSASSVPANNPQFSAAVTLGAPLHSSLLPLLAGQPIALSVRDPFGATSLRQATTGADGVAHFPYSAFSGIDFSQPGAWQFQALFEADDNFLQATSANFETPEAARLTVKDGAGYAIICVGKLDQNAEGLPEHTRTAEFVYRTLVARGFAHEDIYYLSSLAPSGPGITVDDSTPSKADLLGAIQGWAAAAMNTAPAPLYIVLIGHGNAEAFYLYNGSYGADRILTPAELDASLTTLEGSLSTAQDLHLVYGACYSGSFIPGLSAPGRLLVASAEAGEISHRGAAVPGDPNFVRDGEPFVTEYFRGLRAGKTAKAAFETAAALIEEFTATTSSGGTVPQHPLLEDNGDGAGSRRGQLAFEPGQDGALAHQTVLGFGANSAGGSAGWFSAPASVVLGPAQALSLTARATEAPALGHTAWIEVKTPHFAGADAASTASGPEDDYADFQGVLNLLAFPSDTANSDAQGNFTWSSFGTAFDTPGTYKVYYYLQDGITGETSAHLLTTVYRQAAGNTPPPAVNLIYPGEGATASTLSFFAWASSVDPDGDHVTYRIELATDAAFTQGLISVDGIGTTYTQVPGILDGQTYFWRVVPVDQFGASPAGPLPTRTVIINNSNAEVPGALSGAVRMSGSNQRLAGATVTLHRNGILQDTRVTDAQGEFVFTHIDSGLYTVTISAPGFGTVQVFAVNVSAGGATTLNTVSLAVENLITGDVNGDGQINALDGTLISLYILFGHNAASLNAALPQDIGAFRPLAADVNRSGSVTSLDAALINVQQLMGRTALNNYLQSIGQAISRAGEPVP